ncbi:MAG TPA: Na+/H+ antiporter NhaA [Geodermatophilus sp.]|nr:Na+/H+ antiporter NhaA [Geodermatophilus sp.]
MTQPPRPGPPLRVSVPTLSPSSRLYMGTEAGGSVLLLLATLCALGWANSPWAAGYDAFWSLPASVGVGDLTISMDLRHWVNDGAMALFFLVVGLEITREVSTGELRDRRNVAAPALGALGGLVTPALVYLAFNPSGEATAGWGVVMSTDTAFVLGVLALFGPRCPDRLRLFLLTLAIVDDIGAIAVMALFYSDDLVLPALLVAAALVAVLVGLRWAGIWRLAPYLLTGGALWLAVHESGVHATLAGVLLGLLLPSRPAGQAELDRSRVYGRALREQPDAERARMAALAAAATVPANARLQHVLHRWTAYGVVPVFGLANAGVALDAATLRDAAASSVTLGVACALVVGNAIGITLAAGVALRTGWGVLPGGVRWSHLMAGATLAGIGFTISLFIADLAFDDDRLREQATIGILAGSLAAALLGVLLLRVLGDRFPLCTPEAEGPPALPPRPWLEPRVLT